jgi:hypothetical protein
MLLRSMLAAVVSVGAVGLALLAPGPETGAAFAQQQNPATAKIETALSKCVPSDKPRSAHYLLRGVDGEHRSFEGPFLLSRPEANALLPLLQQQAVEADGASTKVTLPSVDKPENCSFLYKTKNSKKWNMKQGSRAYVDKSRDEMVRWNQGVPISETVCEAAAVGSVGVAGMRSVRAYGLTETAACITAKRCLAEESSILGKIPVEDACTCEKSVGGIPTCLAVPKRSKDTAFGVRG